MWCNPARRVQAGARPFSCCGVLLTTRHSATGHGPLASVVHTPAVPSRGLALVLFQLDPPGVNPPLLCPDGSSLFLLLQLYPPGVNPPLLCPHGVLLLCCSSLILLGSHPPLLCPHGGSRLFCSSLILVGLHPPLLCPHGFSLLFCSSLILLLFAMERAHALASRGAAGIRVNPRVNPGLP